MDVPSPRCPVCGESDQRKVRKVVVEEREIYLCHAHAGVVVQSRPRTYEALRALFRDEEAAERRSPLPRRDPSHADRRFFPRPEGRRGSNGRRAADPKD